MNYNDKDQKLTSERMMGCQKHLSLDDRLTLEPSTRAVFSCQFARIVSVPLSRLISRFALEPPEFCPGGSFGVVMHQ